MSQRQTHKEDNINLLPKHVRHVPEVTMTLSACHTNDTNNVIGKTRLVLLVLTRNPSQSILLLLLT